MDHKAVIALEARNDLSTLEVNCGNEGSLGLQSLEEKVNLYNNTCSFCIFIGRELCVIKVHTHG